MQVLLVALGVVGVLVTLAAWTTSLRPKHVHPSGVPTQTIEDYGSRRLARGSVPPPNIERTPTPIPVRPRTQPRARRAPPTPKPLDGRWDLSDRDEC